MRAKKTAGGNRFITVSSAPIGARFKLPPHAVAHASAAVLIAAAGSAYALPQSGVISAGTATIAQPSASSMTVTQTSNKLSLNWQSFDIASGQSVVFNQPAATSIVLNRVIGQNPTTIAGTLNANGQVFVVNPAGVVFGSGAAVNVGGLVASSRPISDLDFLSGTYRFSGSGGGDVRNDAGSILQSNTGGYIALIGRQATNAGTIVADAGTAFLAGANGATLTISNGKLLGYTIDAGTASALAQNAATGVIRADGGRIVLTAKGFDAAAPSVVNNAGVLQAQTIGGTPGNIVLLAASDSAGANADSVTVGSATTGGATLDVSAPGGGNGGRIVLSGPKVQVIDPDTVAQMAPVLTAAAPSGNVGTVQISQTGADADFAVGGGATANISAGTLGGAVGTAAVTIASANNLAINGAMSYAASNNLNLYASRNVNINAPVSNSGTGSLLLRADSAGTGTGTVNFTGSGSISMSGGGRTDLYYNPTSYAAPTDYAPYISGGPYTAWMLVNDLAHLRIVRQAGSYALGRDIDASETAITPFTPIGDTTDLPGNFSGLLGDIDGLNHVISNINIVGGVYSNPAGLIGVLRGSVRNLGIVNGRVQGDTSVGLLVGRNDGLVSNSYSTGVVTFQLSPPRPGQTYTPAQAGGLVGLNRLTVEKSWSSASVTGGVEYAGGLVGNNYDTISESYASGDVYGTVLAGGLVGYNRYASIANSYSTGNASSPNIAGGLVGGNDVGRIVSSYSTGAPQQASTKGAFVGQNTGGDITNSYGRDTGTGLPLFGSTSGGTQFGNKLLTSAQTLNSSNFTGFDFNSVWRQYEGHTAPLLKSFLKPLTIRVADPTKVYDGSAWTGPLPLIYSDQAAAAPGSALTVSSTIDTAPQPYANAGSYVVGYSLDAWSSQQGWDITSIPSGPQTATLTIDAKPVTSTASATDRQYNGTSTVNVTLGALTSVAPGTVTVASAAGAMFDRNAASTSKQVFVQAVLADGTDNAANYMYYSADGVSANISRRTLTVTAVGDTKTYDGQTSSTASPAVVGAVNGDVIAASQTFGTRNVGTGIVLTPTVTIADGNGGRNYAITRSDAQGAITPRPLSLVAVSDTKTYDGTTTSSILPQLSSALYGTDSVRRMQRFDASDVGSRRLIPSYVIDDGNGGANYRVSVTEAQGSITPAYAGSGGASVVDTVLFNQGGSGPVAIHAALLADPASRMPGAIDTASDTALTLASNDDSSLESGEPKTRVKGVGRTRNSGYQFDVKQGGMRLPEGVQ